MLISASIGIMFCLGCQGGGPREADVEGLEASVQRLVQLSAVGQDEGPRFLKALRECIANKVGSDRDLMEWHGNGGQHFGDGQATPIKVDGRRVVIVSLWCLSLDIPGDYPVRLLLLGADGSLLDQVDCIGDAFSAHLVAAVEASPESAAVHVSARMEHQSWEGTLRVIHGRDRLEIPFPPPGKAKEAVKGLTFLTIGVTKDRFAVPEVIH